MDLRIYARNLELNDPTRDYISRKFDRLQRHLAGITTATVELSRESTRAQDQRVVAQLTLDIDGSMLRAEERGANARAAVDSAISIMDRRVERFKGRVYRSEQVKKAGRNASPRTLHAESSLEEASPEEEAIEAAGKVVRVKRFPIKPMTVDEAAFQMDLLGHSFFMFLNGETQQHNVLYVRRDGDYGLIEPEPL